MLDRLQADLKAAMLTRDAFRTQVLRMAIAAAGATSRKDMGKVMKELQAMHGSSYDGKAASQLVQSLLN